MNNIHPWLRVKEIDLSQTVHAPYTVQFLWSKGIYCILWTTEGCFDLSFLGWTIFKGAYRLLIREKSFFFLDIYMTFRNCGFAVGMPVTAYLLYPGRVKFSY